VKLDSQAPASSARFLLYPIDKVMFSWKLEVAFSSVLLGSLPDKANSPHN
jgi:hypothetical protein